MLSGSVFSKQYWTEAVATACYTQNRSTIVKFFLKESQTSIFFMSLDVQFTSTIIKITYENLMKKLMMVIFLDIHLFPRHSVSSILEDNKLKKHITSHLMKSLMLSNSQNLQLTTSTLLKMKDIHLMNIFILMSLLKVSSDQNGQTDQNDQTAQTDEILNNNLSESFNHNNDEQIIDNLPNTEDIQVYEHSSSQNVEDTSI
ncbi:hypothetical protein Tco_0611752 [Tanacetum coccineum]